MNYMISYSWTKNEDEKEKTFTKDSDKDLVKPQHQPQTYVLSYPYIVFSVEVEEESCCYITDGLAFDLLWIAIKMLGISWTLPNRLPKTLECEFIVYVSA